MGRKWFGNGKLKRWVALGLAVVMVGVFGKGEVKADELKNPNGIFEVVAEDKVYNVGDIIETKIYVYNDYPISAFDCILAYDKNVLELDVNNMITYNNTDKYGKNIKWEGEYDDRVDNLMTWLRNYDEESGGNLRSCGGFLCGRDRCAAHGAMG